MKINPSRINDRPALTTVPVQEFFMVGEEVLPLDTAEKLLLDSYRAIPNNEIQESILKITTNATKHD